MCRTYTCSGWLVGEGMERKGGCCLAPRYGAAAAAAQQAGAAWQMGRIMLKFRPIAPKPAAIAPVPAPTPVAAPAVGAGRGKRKAVCGGGGRRGRKPKKVATAAAVTAAPAPPPAAAAAQDAGDRRKDCDKEKSSSSRSSSSSGTTSVDSSPPPRPQQHQLATLPLMPVTPVEDKAAAGAAAAAEEPAPVPSHVAAPAAAGARPFAPRAMHMRPAAAASLVTVEEVTATWRDGEAPSSAACVGSGSGADEAPAFVSDQWGRVTWRNAAFVRAVSADDGGEAEAAPVMLGGALPAWGTCVGFTCRVRVAHSSARRAGSSVVAPCDVWRLDAGGSYLWRLDLQAALTLGGRL